MENGEKQTNNLKRLRLRKGISQRELGDKIHVSDKTISKWEKGQRNISQEYYEELCDYLDTSISYLLGLNKDYTTIPSSNEITKNVRVLNEKNSLHVGYFVTKFVLVALFALLFAFSSFSSLLSIFSLIVLILTFCDAYYFFRKRNQDLLGFPESKDIFAYPKKDLGKAYTFRAKLWTYTIGNLVLITIFIIVYTGLIVNNMVSNFEIYAGAVLVLVTISSIVTLLTEIGFWRSDNTIKIETYLYHKSLIPYGIIVIIFDLVYLVVYPSFLQETGSKGSQIYWIILLFTPLLPILSHMLYLDRVKYLCNFTVDTK